MEHLRDGIGLRGYGQQDPKQEYKKEGYDLFVNMMAAVCSHRGDQALAREGTASGRDRRHRSRGYGEARRAAQQATARHGEEEEGAVPGEGVPVGSRSARPKAQASMPAPASRSAPKIGRNDLCPCGSGKKFKKCHGTTDGAPDENEDATA